MQRLFLGVALAVAVFTLQVETQTAPGEYIWSYHQFALQTDCNNAATAIALAKGVYDATCVPGIH